MGEGAGVIVFESLDHAQKRGATILAEYMGGAFTCDAHHMTDPRPDGLGVSTCIELALKNAGVEREQVGALLSHRRSAAGHLTELTAAGQRGPVSGGRDKSAFKRLGLLSHYLHA